MTLASVRHSVARAGTALLRRGWWRPAAFLLRRAISLAPGDGEAHNNLAIALLKLERWPDAARVAENAVRLDPTSVEALDSLGIALLQMARWDEAVSVYETAVKLDGGRWAVHHRLAVARLQLARWDGAAGALRRAIALANRAPAGSDLAVMETQLVRALAQIDATAPPQVNDVPAAERFRQRQAAFWTPENLGADVFDMAHWLEELSALPEKAASGPRLLFVLDHDFGELATVKFFILGQELAAGSTLLLPDRLHVHNVNAIPGRTHQYGSVEDIFAAVERERSDIVFLCAGYLLCEHLGFSAGDLERLIDGLRERGCRVVTADPFLGMLSKQDPRTLIRVDIPTDHPHFTVEQLTEAKRPAEEQLWSTYAQSERILRDTYHLYPSYCDVTAADVAETDARNLSFFNERLLRPARSAETATPHWLFILGTPDCEIQELFEREAFENVVARKLLEARAAGRHPILVGPRAFVDQVMDRMPTAEGIDILSQIPFVQFYALLLSAEHAFYWNVVSHSLLIRFYNQLPIVQFDHGHLIRTARGIYDRIVRWYYQGWAPPLRNHHETLTLETVEGWAADYRQQAAGLVEGYRRAPSPGQMIAELMARAPSPGLEARVGSR
jgi:tetratricopeptide (TPR) repeat protein